MDPFDPHALNVYTKPKKNDVGGWQIFGFTVLCLGLLVITGMWLRAPIVFQNDLDGKCVEVRMVGGEKMSCAEFVRHGKHKGRYVTEFTPKTSPEDSPAELRRSSEE